MSDGRDIETTLTSAEIMQAALIGIIRQVSAMQRGSKNLHGLRETGWREHIEGACGEMAFAKATRMYWSGSVGTYHSEADVGSRYEVRTRSNHDYDLPVRPADRTDDTTRWVLVTGACPTYMVRGWISDVDVRQPQYWGDPNGRGAAWWVPARDLLPFERSGT